MKRAEIITALVLGIFSIYLMWKSGEPPSWDPTVPRFANIGMIEGEGPGSGFWPFWLSLFMLISCLWIGINWFRQSSPFSNSDEVFLDSYGKRMILVVAGGLFAFLALIHVVGFYGAIPLFMIYYMKYLGRHGWLATILVSSSMTIICFFFFDIAMRIVLPKGYLEPLFIPLYDKFL